MNRIVINEQDLTTNKSSSEITDIVYIPGFASADATASVGDPKICYSLSQFRSYFGSAAPTFRDTQYFPYFHSAVVEGETVTYPGFPQVAIPLDSTDTEDYSTVEMFARDDSDPSSLADPSYIYAASLLSKGLTIIYERMNEVTDPSSENYDVTVARAYTRLAEIYSNDIDSPILDKGNYDIKYMTSGGYPTHEYQTEDGLILSNLMITCAETRGDCVALIDHTDNPHRPLEGTGSVIASTLPNSSYGAMFTPWCNCTNGRSMPASYVYLAALANSIKYNPSWATVAGVSRGLSDVVNSTHTDKPLSNRIAESYQYGYTLGSSDPQICINAITHIRPYGYVIWGNRTLRSYTTTQTGFALTFLNLRNLVSQVKKQAYVTAQLVMFEVNNDVLWTRFKSELTPLLDSMVSSFGLTQYKLLKVTSPDKTKLQCQIILYPTYGVESVNISIVLTDEDLSVVLTNESTSPVSTSGGVQ